MLYLQYLGERDFPMSQPKPIHKPTSAEDEAAQEVTVHPGVTDMATLVEHYEGLKPAYAYFRALQAPTYGVTSASSTASNPRFKKS